MTHAPCQQVSLADLADYAAGELSDEQAAALEDHVFACADCGTRAAQVDALVRAIPPAARLADVGGFVTDDILNRLARDGVRVRTFSLAPGAVVPCAVWDDDEVMVLRLRGDLDRASEVTLSRRVAGSEVSRTTGPVSVDAHGEVLFADSAAWVRELPAGEVEILLTARLGDEERPVGHYTLVHGGAHQRP